LNVLPEITESALRKRVNFLRKRFKNGSEPPGRPFAVAIQVRIAHVKAQFLEVLKFAGAVPQSDDITALTVAFGARDSA
jgi:hypothetical protein